MPVHPSRHPGRADVEELVGRLSAPDPVTRESAVARLIVAGERATTALHALVAETTAQSALRILALRTLASVSQRKANDAAAACVAATDEGLASAAVDVLQDALSDPADPVAADGALEHVTRLALDASVPDRRRLLLIDALSHLPVRLRAPVFDALATDGSSAIAARAREVQLVPRTALERWSAEEYLPASGPSLAEAIHEHGSRVPVTVLRRIIDLVRVIERTGAATERDSWRAARGLLHQTLAERGSVIARYDLREILEDDTQSLCGALLIAARLVGDETCLKAVARRWVAATDDVWLRDQLAQVFRAVVGRARIRRDAAVMTTVLKHLPAAGPLVALAPRRHPPIR